MAHIDLSKQIVPAGRYPAPTPLLTEVRTMGMGDERICIALLDGPVDTAHPCFAGAQLTQLSFGQAPVSNGEPIAHGTHVASIVFGQPGSPVEGLAPRCRGLIVPIFSGQSSDGSLGCSQLDLARAILLAVENGAHVINVSGGQLTPSREADPILANAIETCVRRNVLIVAAAGNDGCECLHVPAAVPSVLAVGAMDRAGNPLPMSNWGAGYLTQGLLAPGNDIPGAVAGSDGISSRTGTSFATPIVSAIAGLLAGLQLARQAAADPATVRSALLKSAEPCRPANGSDCRRYLAGRLNIRGAIDLIQAGDPVMTEQAVQPSSESNITPVSAAIGGVAAAAATFEGSEIRPSGDIAGMPAAAIAAGAQIVPSDCGCGGSGGKGPVEKPPLVYALGRLGYDFGSEARRDSFIQAMSADNRNPLMPADLLAYLQDHPEDSPGLIWTLNLDATPIYAIVPTGAYAAMGFERLREFLAGQVEDGVEMVSIPGAIASSVRLQSGQVVPVVVPAIRGMYSWATRPLARHVLGVRPEVAEEGAAYDQQLSGLTDFLDRVYYDLRNLGVTAEERAINYSATNAIQVAEVIRGTTQHELDLDKVTVRKSPVCRPDSDCYDVEMSFFNPSNTRTANRVFRFTVDVSDVIPVTIGPVRNWTRKE
jgi:cyanobactin maturation PatA/PatG family protease